MSLWVTASFSYFNFRLRWTSGVDTDFNRKVPHAQKGKTTDFSPHLTPFFLFLLPTRSDINTKSFRWEASNRTTNHVLRWYFSCCALEWCSLHWRGKVMKTAVHCRFHSRFDCHIACLPFPFPFDRSKSDNCPMFETWSDKWCTLKWTISNPCHRMSFSDTNTKWILVFLSAYFTISSFHLSLQREFEE